MKLLRRFAAAASLAALLTGCANNKPRYAAPHDIDAKGPFRDPVSGMVFPESIPGFTRTHIARIATDGRDLAVAYDAVWSQGQIAATVYIHPSPVLRTVGMSAAAIDDARDRACRRLFEQRTIEMVQQHLDARKPHVRLVSIAKGGRPRQGEQATSRYIGHLGAESHPIATELDVFCFVDDRWTLEFRYSYPADDDVADRIAAFMGGLDWSGLDDH